jgi:hypothetical protein
MHFGFCVAMEIIFVWKQADLFGNLLNGERLKRLSDFDIARDRGLQVFKLTRWHYVLLELVLLWGSEKAEQVSPASKVSASVGLQLWNKSH